MRLNLFGVIALALVCGVASAADNTTVDERVAAAAVIAWRAQEPAAMGVSPTPAKYLLEGIGPVTFISRLEEGGADNALIASLGWSLFGRNRAPKTEPVPALLQAPGVTLPPLRVALPAFDETGTHALVVGAVDERTFLLALLLKSEDESGGAWRVTWTGRMKATPPAPPTPPLPAGLVPLRVGGDVRAPEVITRVEPVYSIEARRAGITGIVILEAVIQKDGHVASVQVLKPLPMGLGEAAADALRQWEFRPGTLNGLPVDVIFNLTMNFRLTPREQKKAE
jgi:TonB family protein